jgi:FAD/FMN-containing dehydrogenase
MTSEQTKALFAQAIAEDRLLIDLDTLREYSRDTTEHPTGRPDLVIKLQTDAEAKAVVDIAREHQIPLAPRIAGTNLGALAVAPRGGAILDLTEMNRIEEINEVDMIAVIEPGVSFQQLVDHLDERNLALTIGIPLSPPHTSVMANCLLDGLGNLSLRHGTMGQWIAGLEVILSSGEVIRTGAWAVSDIPFGRTPLPDLTGLFVSWQGTTGLVTKMAVELKPKPPLRKRFFVLTYDRRTTYELMRRLARLRFYDDVGGLSWPTGKMMYGIEKPTTRDPDEPEFFTYVDTSAFTEAELKVKLDALDTLLDELRKEQCTDIEKPIDLDVLCIVAPEFKKFSKFPTDLEFLTKNPGGGLTWVGTYGPMSRFDRAADLGVEIMNRHGFPPLIVSRPMKNGHFGVLRFIEVFNRDDETEVQKVRECNNELTEMVLDQGFIPYKTPVPTVAKVLPRMWPGTHDLMRNVRALMDPHGIMNPGYWDLDPK